MDVGVNNNALQQMDLSSAPQYQKENMFMEGSKVSPSKLSGPSKSPSKFTLGMQGVPKSYTRGMKRKSQQKTQDH